MVNGIQAINGGMSPQGTKKEPPYASLFKEHGISSQEVQAYLQEQGYNSPKEVMQALKNGENPFQQLFEEKGITDEEVASYEAEHGKPGQGKGKGSPPGPPPEILQQLQALNLQPTRSLQGDLTAIQQAKQEQQQQGGYNTNFLAPEIIQNFLSKLQS